MAKDTKERPFIDTTTDNLIIDMAKVTMRLRANGSSLRRLQQEVGDDKELREGIIDELTKRSVELHKLEVPFGHTMESLFEKPTKKGEDAE
jgi:hypothetical protein